VRNGNMKRSKSKVLAPSLNDVNMKIFFTNIYKNILHLQSFSNDARLFCRGIYFWNGFNFLIMVSETKTSLLFTIYFNLVIVFSILLLRGAWFCEGLSDSYVYYLNQVLDQLYLRIDANFSLLGLKSCCNEEKTSSGMTAPL
jgi:hypothetical protein